MKMRKGILVVLLTRVYIIVPRVMLPVASCLEHNFWLGFFWHGAVNKSNLFVSEETHLFL